MKPAGAKILLTTGAALAVTGVAYVRAAKSVQISFYDFKINNNGSIDVQLQVYNPSSIFGYPVPVMEFGVFDSNNTFLGTIHNNILQWVPRGLSFLHGTLQPNYNALGSAITMLGGLQPADITLQGFLRLGRVNVPVTTGVNI